MREVRPVPCAGCEAQGSVSALLVLYNMLCSALWMICMLLSALHGSRIVWLLGAACPHADAQYVYRCTHGGAHIVQISERRTLLPGRMNRAQDATACCLRTWAAHMSSGPGVVVRVCQMQGCRPCQYHIRQLSEQSYTRG